jgi:hypothetical protein
MADYLEITDEKKEWGVRMAAIVAPALSSPVLSRQDTYYEHILVF